MMVILNPASELSLDFKPTFIPKTITQFLGEVARIGSVCEKISKVDDFVSRLEIELIKIKAFQRELPLCMLLMNDAIEALKEESSVFKKSGNQPTLEEFIPLKKTCDDEEPKAESDNGDKRNWLSSTQLWNSNENNLDTKNNNIPKQKPVQQVIQKRDEEEQDGMIESPFSGNSRREFIPFKGYYTRNEDKEELPIPGLSLITPGIKNSVRGNGFLTKTCAIQSDVKIGTPQLQPPQQQTSRKQRRCWSTELHRRFLNALQQLGGSKAATPKQIRELMRVDGLTNDEVKSHLQKYRLHTRKFPSSNPSPVPLWTHDQYLESSKYKHFHQSGSPDGPLNRTTTAGTSTTGGDSMDDGEDEKSENNCWKNHPYTSAKDNV